MEIWFSNTTYLWLLMPVPIFVAFMLLSLKKGKNEIEKFISPHSLEFLFKRGDFILKYIRKNFLFSIFRMIVYILTIFAITGITIYYDGISKEQSIVIAIDASGSMLAEDINPNRLEAVKETINILLEKTSPKSEIAILSFSGNAYIEQELSNKEELKKQKLVLLISERGEKVIAEQELTKIAESIKIIKNIQISPISGTSIGIALKTAANMLNKEKKPKSVLLISDGSENVMDEKGLNNVINTLNEEHITINVIGIGKIEGAKLPGIDLPSNLNEPLLESIAEKTNGIYQRAETKQSLTDAYKKIISETRLKIPIRLRLPLIIASILLLLVDYVFIRLA